MFFQKDKKVSEVSPDVLALLPLRRLGWSSPTWLFHSSWVAPLVHQGTGGGFENGSKQILLATQRVASVESPTESDIFETGTVANIIQMLRLPDGTVKVLVEGKSRASIERYVDTESFFKVAVSPIESPELDSEATLNAIRRVKAAFEDYVKLNQSIPPEMLMSIASIEDPSRLADTLVAQLNIKLEERQQLLENGNPLNRLAVLEKFIQSEIEILQVEKKIKRRVRKQMEKSQKEVYLNEQMEAIQRELGERDEFKSEIAEIEARIARERGSPRRPRRSSRKSLQNSS